MAKGCLGTEFLKELRKFDDPSHYNIMVGRIFSLTVTQNIGLENFKKRCLKSFQCTEE